MVAIALLIAAVAHIARAIADDHNVLPKCVEITRRYSTGMCGEWATGK
jgi:hypothetical protein